MGYIIKRNEPTLGLKVGDKLKHEFGKLPSALTFAADWHDEAEEAKPKTKAELAAEKKAAKEAEEAAAAAKAKLEAEEAQAKLDAEAAANLPQE